MGLGCEKRRLVVIGGGVAGSLIAKSLQFHADLTLIDQSKRCTVAYSWPSMSKRTSEMVMSRVSKYCHLLVELFLHSTSSFWGTDFKRGNLKIRKEYFEIPWASLRTMVEPSVGERSVINHRDYLTNARIITSSAINISETEVLTGEGRLVPYDYLVIATGHTDPTIPKTRTERLKQYKEENEKIDLASSILIVGGGPTGVELAAEIAVDFPDKKLTLVHNGSRLLQFIGQKASDKTLNWLASKKVEVMLEKSVSLDNISNGNSTSYRTSDGETLNADCHFLCTAKSLGSTWLKHTVLESNLDSYGRLMVDENLRVKGRNNIFAIGDITDVPEIKQGYLAQKHALVAAKNLKLLMEGGKESKPGIYKPRSVKAIVSLGRRDAVAQLPFTTIIGSVPGLIKSRDLFVGKTRKQLGLDPHVVYDH